MEINQMFRLVRKQRKLSLNQLSKIAGSSASISDFENGKTSLSIASLTPLLNELQIELNEFFSLENTVSDSRFTLYLQQAQDFLSKNLYQNLQSEVAILEQIFEEEKNYKYRVLSLTIKLVLAESGAMQIDQNEILELTDYFWSISVWTNFDIAMFGNILSFFETQTILDITMELLETIPNRIISTFQNSIKVDTAIHALLALLSRKDKEGSRLLLTSLKHISLSQKLLHERMAIASCEIIFEILWGDFQNASQKKMKLLGGLQLLLDKNEFFEIEDLFDKFITIKT